MNSKRIARELPGSNRGEIDENDFRDLLAYLKQHIHRPTHNVYMQYFKKLSGQEYNWWKENQRLF